MLPHLGAPFRSRGGSDSEWPSFTPLRGETCVPPQEQPAVMFCAEDRALICRQCDLMIHTANEFTKTHHRYILSGFAAGLRALPEPRAGAEASPAASPGAPPPPASHEAD